MKFSDNAMSAILLCSYIGMNNDDVFKPLTLKEWNELLDKAVQQGQQPSVVMDQNQSFLREAGYSQDYIERIKRLLSRGGTVAFKLDELEGKGIELNVEVNGVLSDEMKGIGWKVDGLKRRVLSGRLGWKGIGA